MVEKAVIMEDASVFKVSSSHIDTKTNIDSLNLESNEKHLIIKAINNNNGNFSLAAKELGISRKTLYNKVEKYDI